MAGLLENPVLSQSPSEILANSVRCLSQNSAILQYQPGEERFKLKILRNGRLFNFDRAVSETVQAIKERLTTNITKKVKNFNGDVKLFVYEREANDDTMLEILENGVNNLNVLKIQIGDDIFKVDFNPPEIFQMKIKKAMAGFPIFPVKIEATKNFVLKESKFEWELVKEKRKEPKKSSIKTEPEKVETCIHSDLIYFPTEEAVGSFLRFTCTPSDGLRFGIPVSVETAEPVCPPYAKNLIFHERLSRLDPKKDDPSFTRVVSYNCLADTYATPEWFVNSPATSLDIDYRLPLLNQEIFSYNGDIVCLQEVDSKYYEGNFEPFLTLYGNYEGAFSSKVGKTKEGVATFFKKDKFSLLSSETVFILEHMKSLPLWESTLSKNAALITRLEDRNTVLQVSVVQSKANPNLLLVVANTHLYYHPDADHIRLLQTITCVDYIQSTIKKLEAENPSKNISLIFCGDFNCTPPFSSFRLLVSGQIKGDDDDWFSHETEQLIPGMDFQHNLNIINANTDEMLTNITMCFEGCIDYIFYQPSKVKLLKTYPPPDKTILATLTETTEARVSLPNFKTPSDHLPLISDFLLPSQ